ncbi:MAG: phosphoribosyl 1,2-cyclic phosphodiesterase [Paraglaciecola sp.]|jgi:phosphoribosyl 1,2-cyclic phosphodiesterase
MKYKFSFYISIAFLLIACGGNDEESVPSEPLEISDTSINIGVLDTDENTEDINDTIVDSDTGTSPPNTDENTDNIINDIDDSDPGGSSVNTEESTEDNDIDDSDPDI